MKKKILLLFTGIIVSYCFTCMVLNQKIVNPVTLLHNTPFVFERDELYANMNDFEIISENRLLSTSTEPWIEVKNIQERIKNLRSVVYKVKPIVKLSEENTVLTRLKYADTNQEYNDYRQLTSTYKGESTIIFIPNYAEPIDKLRLELTILDDTILEITEISLNTDAMFSIPLFGFIYCIWLAMIFFELRPSSGK